MAPLALDDNVAGLNCLLVRTVIRGSVHRTTRQLCRVPNGDDPHRLADHAIEESIWGNDDLTMRQFRELGDRSTGLRKLAQSAQSGLGFRSKLARGRRIFLTDVLQPLEELPPR